jgi:hypothetical protein
MTNAGLPAESPPVGRIRMIMTMKTNSTRVERETKGQKLVPLPEAPKTKSPVPWLTSIHATPGRGEYGDPAYRGNCSGLLIRDLLRFYQPKSVLDPMAGSGTCADVCRELKTRCVSCDLKTGFDATQPEQFRGLGRFDFIWLHPPYYRMIRYSDDPRCLSNAETFHAFLSKLSKVIVNCRDVLSDRGVLAILMGDHRHKGEYLGLPFYTLDVAATKGLWLAAPEIIRFSHGTTSAAREYPFSFIPRVHDVCLVLKRGLPPLPERD